MLGQEDQEMGQECGCLGSCLGSTTQGGADARQVTQAKGTDVTLEIVLESQEDLWVGS